MQYVIIYLWLVNIAAFLLYGIDKRKAKKEQYRILEKVLLGIAVAGGSVGAFIGMRVFRHKTRKPKFYLGVPIIFLAQVGIVAFLQSAMD